MKLVNKKISNNHQIYELLNGAIKFKFKISSKTENIQELPLNFDFKYVFNFMIGKGVTPTRYMQDKFLEYNVPNQSGIILELGSGDKDFTKNLAKSCSKFIKSDYEPSKPDVIKIDATNIDLADDSVDCVITVSMLEHIYNYQKVADEIYRVLKPGGKIICATPFSFCISSEYRRFLPF